MTAPRGPRFSAGHRAERVAEQIHHDISLLFGREISDPRMANANVTRVQVTGDLRIARIYVSPRGTEEETREMMEAMERATGYFRRTLAQSLDLRFAPELRFLVDPAIEKGEHFLKVLGQVEQEETSPAPQPQRSAKAQQQP